MNKNIIHIIKALSLIIMLNCPLSLMSQDTEANLDINALMRPLTENGIFRDADYYNWGGSIIKDNDGLYHLFYSRWKRAFTFDGWLTASEIAHAVSATAAGPWEYRETVIKGRGHGYWDGITAHNPKIKFFEGRYYLYYIATNGGDSVYTEQDLAISSEKKLNGKIKNVLRANQRTGVAVSSTLNGPWTRSDAPLIEPSGPIATLTVNPAIAQGKDGNYYLIVKGDKPNETRFIRNQAIATAKSPTGPFTMQPNPVIDNLDTEDVSMWHDEGGDKFYAVFHAHSFVGLMESADGLHWKKAQNYRISDKNLLLEDGSILKPGRMERPFVYVEDGKPNVLCLAIKKGNDSYTIFISLVEKE